jgi:hypothetical protein
MDGVPLAFMVHGRRDTVAQRSIEVFIGRIITDEGFRQTFAGNATAAIRLFIDTGHELTSVEIAALVAMRPDFWERVADEVDPRLQKASLALTRIPS